MPDNAHMQRPEEVLERLRSTRHGLPLSEVNARREIYGENRLPRREPDRLWQVFLRQFLSPLIYILLIAAVVSLLLEETTDALFIFIVLLINALIGSVQEFSAQRSAEALNTMVTAHTRVLREGSSYEIDTQALVPGDIVLLDSGFRVPADLRLLQCHELQLDESLLTGESLPVVKDALARCSEGTPLAERRNMAFAGSLVLTGRAQGVVVAIASETQLGLLANAVLVGEAAKAPLLLRMELFTRRVALVIAVVALILAAVAAVRGYELYETFNLAVALAISAIPEGLPVAITVALAVGMRRMASRNVIVRRLVAMEALGSCTYIASDKTGTLTLNVLTAERITLLGHPSLEVTGAGIVPEGEITQPPGGLTAQQQATLRRLLQTAVLANEGYLAQRDGEWVSHGDALDVALLVLARKAGLVQEELQGAAPQRAAIPYESVAMYAASLNQTAEGTTAFIKGALEALLPMCCAMETVEGLEALDENRVEAAARTLSHQGYRVLAFASGPLPHNEEGEWTHQHLQGCTLLGLVGLRDPLRPEARGAVAACRRAGIAVAMITGDHPATAYSIAAELGIAGDEHEVVTGPHLKLAAADSPDTLDAVIRNASVFARVEPKQKLDIVHSLQRQGHFVAVTGDGANDAPALKASHVGVAMGKGGSDVARETADILLTDDNFASIVSGVEEGRIAYANVRKVIFLLLSTGAAELVLFILTLLAGLPLPLLAVQLLWLNLVTNGIQDVALAFEPGEGDELHRPPRSPHERIFNRIMIERVVLSALTMGVVAFATFDWLLEAGYNEMEARNGVLLLMVLFENVHVFNSRSENRSALRHNPLRNRLLLFGTLAAQGVHIGAMYTPGINTLLDIQPVSPAHWVMLLGLALTILLVMELHKGWRNGFR